jgi:uncharacterized RDD family membrane protein YckC
MVTPTNNLYAPPKSTLADVATEADNELASRGSRLGAVILDGLILGLPFVPSYMIAFSRLGFGHAAAGRGANPFAVYAAIGGTGIWFYLGLACAIVSLSITTALVSRNGQTIGKKWLGIKVVRKDGSKATLARIFWLRYLLNTVFMLIPFLGTLYSLIDPLFIFGAAKRCVHDHLADTIVVRA